MFGWEQFLKISPTRLHAAIALRLLHGSCWMELASTMDTLEWEVPQKHLEFLDAKRLGESLCWFLKNTPPKTNMEHNHGGGWKIIFLSKWVICRFHVNLPGCNQFYIIWSCLSGTEAFKPLFCPLLKLAGAWKGAKELGVFKIPSL